MLRLLYDKIVSSNWYLAVLENTIDEVMSGAKLNAVKINYHFTDRWFADPFVLDVDQNNIVLLVEEFRYSDGRGRISRMTITRKEYDLVKLEDVLVLPTHLSFPNILRDGNKLYIYPENNLGGGLFLYEYDPVANLCTRIKTLSKDRLTDAVYTNIFGQNLIFTTREPNPNNNVLDVYKKNSDGFYSKADSLIFEEKVARNGGAWFPYQNQVYRPAQVCNETYGQALSIQKVDFEQGKFTMKEVRRISPPTNLQAFGIHTLNSFKGIVVIDYKTFHHPCIAKPLYSLRNKMSWLIKHK